MEEITVKTINKLDDSFIYAWEMLWKKSANSHFYNSPSWFISCLKAFNFNNYLILVFEKNGEILSIFPLVYTRKFGINVLASPGGEILNKSTLLIANDHPLLIDTILKNLTKFGNLYLAYINQALIESYSLPQNFLKIHETENPYITLDEEPLRFLSPKQRSKIINRYKRFKKYLKVEYHVGSLDKYIDIIKKIDNKSYKKGKGFTTFSDSKKAQGLIEQLQKELPGSISIGFLYFGNTPIIYFIGLISGKTYFAYQTAFHKDYRFITPGKIVLMLLLNQLKVEGFTLFDFGISDSILKSEFTKTKRYNYDLYFSRNSYTRNWWKINIAILKILKGRYFYDLFCMLRKNIYALRQIINLKQI